MPKFNPLMYVANADKTIDSIDLWASGESFDVRCLKMLILPAPALLKEGSLLFALIHPAVMHCIDYQSVRVLFGFRLQKSQPGPVDLANFVGEE